MPPVIPVLHMLCGKVASGKSTLCAELARRIAYVPVDKANGAPPRTQNFEELPIGCGLTVSP